MEVKLKSLEILWGAELVKKLISIDMDFKVSKVYWKATIRDKERKGVRSIGCKLTKNVFTTRSFTSSHRRGNWTTKTNNENKVCGKRVFSLKTY